MKSWQCPNVYVALNNDSAKSKLPKVYSVVILLNHMQKSPYYQRCCS